MTDDEIRAQRDVAAAVGRGWKYFRQGDTAAARAWFERADGWAPGHPYAAHGLALLAVLEGKPDVALKIAGPFLQTGLHTEFRSVAADALRALVARADEAGHHAAVLRHLAELGKYRPLRRDEATLRAWALFRSNHHAEASAAFAELYRARPDVSTAGGLFYSGASAGRLAAVEALARSTRGPLGAVFGFESAARYPADEEFNQLREAALAIRAGHLQQAKKYAASLTLLAQLEARRPLTRGEQTMRGWDHFNLGDARKAEPLFETLYREHADEETATGFFYSASKAGHRAHAEAVAQELSGPLLMLLQQNPVAPSTVGPAPSARDRHIDRSVAEGLFYSSQKIGRIEPLRALPPSARLTELLAEFDRQARQRTADDLASRGLLMAAAAAAPATEYPARHYLPPALAVGAGARSKSGESGLSQLATTALTVAELRAPEVWSSDLTASVQALQLDAGALARATPVGTFPTSPRNPRFAATTSLDALIAPMLALRHEGWTSWRVELGSTPIGGPVSPLPTGRIELTQQTAHGEVRAEVRVQPIRESILSYTGIRDPYTGRAWGRVEDASAQVSTFQDLGHDWGFNAHVLAGYLFGRNVEGNGHAGATLGLSRDLHFAGFRFASIGPRVSWEGYEQNLSHFTTGHGGYFSPEHIVEASLDVNFQTAEGRRALLAGHLGIGGQMNRQAAAPFFPQNSDGREYPGTSASSLVLSARLQAVLSLSDRWQLGANLELANSASYDDLAALIFLRFLLEPRSQVYRYDLLTWP